MVGTFLVSSFNSVRVLSRFFATKKPVIRQKRDLTLLQSQSTCRLTTAHSLLAKIIRSPIHPHCISLRMQIFLVKGFPITNSPDGSANSGKGQSRCMPGRRYAFREASKDGSEPQNEIYKKGNHSRVDGSSYRGGAISNNRKDEPPSCLHNSDSVIRNSFQTKTSTGSGTP